MTLTDDDILSLGGFCKELLGAEAFKVLVQMYSQQCAADMLGTQPNEASVREALYAQYQGFESFLSTAKEFAEAFDKLHKEPKQNPVEPTPDDLIDDPSVHDIYDGTN